MFLKTIHSYVILTVLAVSLLVCSPARAFFPSDADIDDTMYHNYGALTSFEAVLTFPSAPGTSLTIRRGHDHWQQTFISQPDSNSTVTAGSVGHYFKTIAQCPQNVEMPVSVLQLWTPDDPVSDWKSIGVSNATRSYGFYRNTPVFVFGAEAGDDNSPQVWFDNESFAPVKVVLGEGRSVSLGSYSKFAGFMLPHTGKFQVGEESLDFMVEWKGIRKKISPSVFSATALKNQAGCSVPTGAVFEMLKKCLKLKLRPQ